MKTMISESQAKRLIDGFNLPEHDSVACGILWDATCANCLLEWEDHERQGEMPTPLQNALGFRQIVPPDAEWMP